MADSKVRRDYLETLNRAVKDRFVKRKNILGFNAFFELFLENPGRFTRSTYQYLLDMIDHFGPRKGKDGKPRPGFAVFDQKFRDGQGAVWGQAMVENQIYRLLAGFSRSRKADRLILLHGPNGSAKTSLVGCLHAGMEEYSRTDEGALYHFNWIFPEERFTREKIGFSKEASREIDAAQSYADLPEDRIAARLGCPLRDNPLFLIPQAERRSMFEELRGKNKEFASSEMAEILWDGDLSPMNRQIYDALLGAYGGDYARVLQHVQVERYYISERYKVGSVVIEPQMSVDARIQQVTADRSLSSLPPVLQNLNLFMPQGYLVNANHGIVEYSDLLKRPVDAYKYLLGTCEKGTINLDVALIYLDIVMMGSSNDKYLEGFKGIPDFTSFKARMEMIRVPYLRDFQAEKHIYESQLALESENVRLMPHMREIVALWAVLTRLRKPKLEHYPAELQAAIDRLNPLEKALFLSDGEPPDWFSMAQAKELRAIRGRLINEFSSGPLYEGGFGASPREGKMILQNAVQGNREGLVGPRQVLMQIRRLIGDKSVYEWLQHQPDGEYGDQMRLVALVENYYIRKIDIELKNAMEMVEEEQYSKLLEKYVAHASSWIHGRKVVDAVSRAEVPVDENFLREVEKIIASKEEAKAFRQDVISRVGAYALDNPDEKVAYEKIFSKSIRQLEEHYFGNQKERIHKFHENLLKFFEGSEKLLEDKERQEIDRVLLRMEERYGYVPEATREVVAILARTKYAKSQISDDTPDLTAGAET